MTMVGDNMRRVPLNQSPSTLSGHEPVATVPCPHPQAAAERGLLEMVAAGRPVRDVLDALCRHIETQIAPGCRCGVYRVDAQRQRLQAVAGPSVYATFNTSISQLPMNSDASPCMRAVCLGAPVTITDVDTDPLWRDTLFRKLAAAHDHRSYWSMPIMLIDGEVIGTLMIMQRRSAEPTQSQLESMNTLSRMAGIAYTIAQRLASAHRVEALSAAACIAHEISQPLSGMVTNAGLCLRLLSEHHPDVRAAQEAARRMFRDGTRAAQVINALRALFSRKDLAAEAVNLNEVAAEVITSMTEQLRFSRVLLQTDFEADLPRIAGNGVQLRQVIMNLLLNACDAMSSVDDRQRHVQVRSARGSDGRVLFSVTDSGVGLQGTLAEHLFQPFQSTRPQGMGIGLFLSRCIIERHHGELTAASNEGPGATFSFSVPSLGCGTERPLRPTGPYPSPGALSIVTTSMIG